jgi:hypothetical protein
MATPNKCPTINDLHKIESPSLWLLTAAHISLDSRQESTLHPQGMESFYDARGRHRRNLASITLLHTSQIFCKVSCLQDYEKTKCSVALHKV